MHRLTDMHRKCRIAVDRPLPCAAAGAVRKHSMGSCWTAVVASRCVALARLRFVVAAVASALVGAWLAADVLIVVRRTAADFVEIAVTATAGRPVVAADGVGPGVVVIVVRLCHAAGVLPGWAVSGAAILAGAGAANLTGCRRASDLPRGRNRPRWDHKTSTRCTSRSRTDPDIRTSRDPAAGHPGTSPCTGRSRCRG